MPGEEAGLGWRRCQAGKPGLVRPGSQSQGQAADVTVKLQSRGPRGSGAWEHREGEGVHW